VAGTHSASNFPQPHPFETDEALVAAAEYASYDRASSELSGPTSDVSSPSQGWASAAATEKQEPAMAVMARLPGCHVCYGKDHFLLDCPLLSTELKHRIEVHRAQKIRQDRGGDTAGGGEPSLRTPYTQPFANGAAPRPASQLPGRPICPPRRGAHVRVTPVVFVHNRPRRS
jgi:hypothetical protein